MCRSSDSDSRKAALTRIPIAVLVDATQDFLNQLEVSADLQRNALASCTELKTTAKLLLNKNSSPRSNGRHCEFRFDIIRVGLDIFLLFGSTVGSFASCLFNKGQELFLSGRHECVNAISTEQLRVSQMRHKI